MSVCVCIPTRIRPSHRPSLKNGRLWSASDQIWPVNSMAFCLCRAAAERDAVQDRGEVGVGDRRGVGVGEDDSDCVHALVQQAPRDCARVVAEMLGGPQDPLTRLRPYRAGVVQDEGNGCGGHAAFAGDVFNVCHSVGRR